MHGAAGRCRCRTGRVGSAGGQRRDGGRALARCPGSVAAQLLGIGGRYGLLAVLVAAAVAVRQEKPAAAAGDPPPPEPQPVADWVVDRGQGDDVVAAVCGSGRAVGITTSLSGAGGFGKTTLAGVVCANPQVRRRFRGRVYTVTIGRDVRGRAAIAAKVAEATRFITGNTEEFDDPALAGAHLGRLLNQRPRTLLVLDDVWEKRAARPVPARWEALRTSGHDPYPLAAAARRPVDPGRRDVARPGAGRPDLGTAAPARRHHGGSAASDRPVGPAFAPGEPAHHGGCICSHCACEQDARR